LFSIPSPARATTLIAAERTWRRGVALELDPKYVDTAVRRWEELTGGSARHATTGSSFAEMATEARAPVSARRGSEDTMTTSSRGRRRGRLRGARPKHSRFQEGPVRQSPPDGREA